VRKLEKSDPSRALAYREWLEGILTDYSERILPITTSTMRVWGPLTYDLRNTNPDLLIAATALEHNLTVVTRNIRHFEPTGAKLFSPYE
jgi:predicted nucleic acid-binding protein